KLLEPVGGHADAALFQLQEFHCLTLVARAQDEPNGRFLTGLHVVLLQPTEVQLHLSLVSRLKVSELQLNRHKAPESSVEEEHVEVVIVAIDRDAFLPSYKRK